MAFESGITNEFYNKLLLYYKVIHFELFKILKLKSLLFEIKDDEDYNVITYDVIERGPLFLLIIGIIFSCLCFIIELIVFFCQ